jgi:hypothetical protein
VATCPSGHQSASDDFCDVCGVLIGAPPILAPGQAPDGSGSLAGGSVPGGSSAGGSVTQGAGTVPGALENCPNCGTIRVGPFCEACGYSFAAGSAAGTGGIPAAATVWPGASGASGQVQPAPTQPAPAHPGPTQSTPVQAAPTQPAPVEAAPQAAPAGSAPPAGWAAVVSADRAYYDAVLAASGPDAADIVFPAYVPQRRFRLAGPEVRIGRRSVSSGINPEIDLSVPPADPGVSRLHAVLLLAPDGTWSVVDPGSANGTVLNGTEIPQGQAVPLRDGDRINVGVWTELRLIHEA